MFFTKDLTLASREESILYLHEMWENIRDTMIMFIMRFEVGVGVVCMFVYRLENNVCNIVCRKT